MNLTEMDFDDLMEEAYSLPGGKAKLELLEQAVTADLARQCVTQGLNALHQNNQNNDRRKHNHLVKTLIPVHDCQVADPSAAYCPGHGRSPDQPDCCCGQREN